MKVQEIAKSVNTRWLMFSRESDKSAQVTDTNHYLVIVEDRAIILDPGGIELFAPILAAVLRQTPVETITDIFASHQDPDVISSLGLWDKTVPNAKLHTSSLWTSFGMESIQYVPLADQGGDIDMGAARLQVVPAHYLHSSGNFHIYDPATKVLMSGDVGASSESAGAALTVERFEEHIPRMEDFHRRWMPSNRAKNNWIARVRRMDIDIIAPQRGRLYTGANIPKFLDWFEGLDVGTAVA